MIEMRWLAKTREVMTSLSYVESRVLQYRFLGESVTWHGKAGAIRRQEWSEWQDVPDVIDPTSNSVAPKA